MSARSRTERAHQKYRDGQYEQALQLYSDALALARPARHRIALHSNRAACYLKLQNFRQAAEECSAVLELDPKHAGALMLRTQTLVALKDYHSALFDVNRLLEIDPSSDVYLGLQARLKTQLSLPPILEGEEEESPPGSPVSRALAASSPITALPTTEPDAPCPKGWDAIPKPKGHSGVNYSRWDALEAELSSDEEEEEEEPQYRYKFKSVEFTR